MPAFCQAISSSVLPRMLVWSRSNEVIPQTLGERTIFVLSYSPPIPTSRMATSTFSWTKMYKDITVKKAKKNGMSPSCSTCKKHHWSAIRRNTVVDDRWWDGLKVFFFSPGIPCGWLSSKHKLTNQLTITTEVRASLPHSFLISTLCIDHSELNNASCFVKLFLNVLHIQKAIGRLEKF